MPSEKLDPRFAETMFVVEADDFARHMLWVCHSRESIKAGYAPRDSSPHDWVQHGDGRFVQVGSFGGMPVNISVFWSTIDGQLVLFYDMCSMVTHSDMVRRWFEKHCNPKYDGGSREARCNAMNFAHCLQAIEEKNSGLLPYRERGPGEATVNIAIDFAKLTSPEWRAGVGLLAQAVTVAVDAAGRPVSAEIVRLMGPDAVMQVAVTQFCKGGLPVVITSPVAGGREFAGVVRHAAPSEPQARVVAGGMRVDESWRLDFAAVDAVSPEYRDLYEASDAQAD